MKEKFAFISSTRFWSMILGAIAIYLEQEGIISQALSQLLATVAAGFVIVKTTDKFNK